MITRDAAYYRSMAEVCQRQLDTMTPGARLSFGPRIETERDQWNALADELEEYLDNADEGAWQPSGTPDEDGLF